MELDLLSLDSVVRFSNLWNARLSPLHVLINNAGIFAMGGWFIIAFYLSSFELMVHLTLSSVCSLINEPWIATLTETHIEEIPIKLLLTLICCRGTEVLKGWI